MRLLCLIVMALLILGSPSRAEDSSPEKIAWSLFTKHCTQYLEANTISEIKAAFEPHGMALQTTTDGALVSGATENVELPEFDDTSIVMTIATTRIEGGTYYNCTLQIIGQNDAFNNLPRFIQENAGDVLGKEFNVHGGFAIGGEENGAAALIITTPGFPPERSINATHSQQFNIVSLVATIKD